MAIQFMNMPAAQYPRSALLDFAPLTRSLQNYSAASDVAQQQRNMTQIGQTAANQGYGAAGKQALALGETDAGMELNRQGEAQKDRFVKRYGTLAQQIDLEQDPQRRATMWQGTLERMRREGASMGVSGEFDPEELDPGTGPKLLMAQAGLVSDPLDREHKQAQINKLNRDATESAARFGKSGDVVKGPDGNYYTVRYASDGTEQINPLSLPGAPSSDGSAAPQAPVPLTPSRGTDVVGDTIVDKETGRTVRNVGDALAAGEQRKVEGKETGERKMALPKARASLRALETQHRNVIGTIEKALPMVNAWTTGLAGQGLSRLGGSDANNLRIMLNTVKANMGFDKLQDMRDNSPTGGALGQVAVAELEMLQSAFASVEQSQTGEQLRENMTYLVGLLKEMQDNRRMAFDDTYGNENRPQASPQATTKFNWTPDGGLQEAK